MVSPQVDAYSPAAAPAALAAPSPAPPRPDASFLASVSGPEPGYDATSKIVCACALTLLRDRQRMRHQAGVVTPGAAFRGTHLVERLERAGLRFSLEKQRG